MKKQGTVVLLAILCGAAGVLSSCSQPNQTKPIQSAATTTTAEAASTLIVRVSGPFVLCENADGQHLDILTPKLVDPANNKTDHFGPGMMASNNGYDFPMVSGFFELKLGSQRTQGQPPHMEVVKNGTLRVNHEEGRCDSDQAQVRLRLPIPDAILPLMPSEDRMKAMIVEVDDPSNPKEYSVKYDVAASEGLATLVSLHFNNADLSHVDLVAPDDKATPLQLVAEAGSARLDLHVLPYPEPDLAGFQTQTASGYLAMSRLLQDKDGKSLKARCLVFDLKKKNVNCGYGSAKFDIAGFPTQLNLEVKTTKPFSRPSEQSTISALIKFVNAYMESAELFKTTDCHPKMELMCQPNSKLGACK